MRDDREEADHFGLCEVEVFKAQGEIGVVGLFDVFLFYLNKC